MRVYISGPMRGRPNMNFHAFDQASARVRAVGWEPVNPADLDRQANDLADMASAQFLRRAIRRDIEALFDCDGIVLLQGWRHSAGAVTETAVSCVLQLRAFDALTLHDITDDIREWWNDTLGGGNQWITNHPISLSRPTSS